MTKMRVPLAFLRRRSHELLGLPSFSAIITTRRETFFADVCLRLRDGVARFVSFVAMA